MGIAEKSRDKLVKVFNDIAVTLKPVEVPPYPAPPPAITTPSDWSTYEQHYIHDNKDKNVGLVFSPSRTGYAKGDILYSLGWKTHPLEKREIIEDFQNRGYNVITMRLVEANGSLGTMAENITRMKNVLFNKDSILFDLHNKDQRPLFVVPHSTSAAVYETSLQESKVENLYRPDIELVVPVNPFIHPVGLGTFYRWYANQHLNDHAGEPLPDRLYYLFCGIANKLEFEDIRGRPTHGQILEISAYGDTLLANYNFGERSDPPVMPYISKNDNFASPSKGEKFYKNKENLVNMHIVRAGHNVLKLPELRSEIIDKFDQKSEMFKPKNLEVAPPLVVIRNPEGHKETTMTAGLQI